MYEKLEECPVCGSKQFSNFLICEDHTVTHESFAIVECHKCSFKFTNPRPTAEKIGSYYQSDEYVSHNNSAKGIVNQAYMLVRKFTLLKKLKLINSFGKKEKTLLDIGCGTGMFLEVCKKNGWQVSGTEPNEKAREEAIRRTNSTIASDFLNDLKGENFQVITLWHVLEHIHELDSSIQKIKKLLAPEGTLIIAVPNCESYDAKLYKEQWAAYDVPRHLYHFSPETIKTLFKKYRMKVEKVLPMEWDAYYISLMSNQYKVGRSDYFEAIKNGRLSNQWAKQNGNNYSSLIYLIKK